jgi:predicted NBD/HSP70 family sugar kinase
VTAEAVDAHGTVLARSHRNLCHSDGPRKAARALAEAAADLATHTTVTLRLAVVSGADPVDRAAGRLVHLPDAPFLVGELDPPSVLAPHVQGAVLVDNDINWAAQAEHHQGCAVDVADFVYLHLGEGLGCADAVSLADPRLIMIGREWGTQAGIAAEVREHFASAGRRP